MISIFMNTDVYHLSFKLEYVGVVSMLTKPALAFSKSSQDKRIAVPVVVWPSAMEPLRRKSSSTCSSNGLPAVYAQVRT